MQNRKQISQGFLKQQSLYFKDLKQKLKSKIQKEHTNQIQSMIKTEIDEGSIQIKLKSQNLQNTKQYEQLYNQKSLIFNKNHNLGFKLKLERSNSAKLPSKINIQQTQMRIIKLKEETEEINRKKREQQKNRQLIRLKQEQKRIKKESQQIKEKEKLRRQKIVKKIQQIQKYKQQRTQIIKNSKIDHLPKFIQMKYKYQNNQEKYLKSKNQQYKNIIKQKFQKYKPNHQQARLRAISQQNQHQKIIKQNNFRLIGKDGSIIHKQMKKRQKMRDFQRNVSQKIRIHTDINKKIQLQENKQKLKTRFKTYRTLQQYDIDKKSEKLLDNKNMLGNKYMKDASELARFKMQQKNKNRKVKTDIQQSRIQNGKGYKNYLNQVRHQLSKKQRNQIQEIMKKYPDKSKIMQILQTKSSKHAYNVIQKIRKLDLIQSYDNKILTQAQIDNQYMQSLKARLACINLAK